MSAIAFGAATDAARSHGPRSALVLGLLCSGEHFARPPVAMTTLAAAHTNPPLQCPETGNDQCLVLAQRVRSRDQSGRAAKGRFGTFAKSSANGRYLRIAVVHCVAVSGASRDRVLLAAAREPQNDVGITLAGARVGSAGGRQSRQEAKSALTDGIGFLLVSDAAELP